MVATFGSELFPYATSLFATAITYIVLSKVAVTRSAASTSSWNGAKEMSSVTKLVD